MSSHDLSGRDLSGPIDSHCHLQNLPADERERAVDYARQRGVKGFLVPATKLSEAEDILAFCHRHPDVWCALGVHPHDASTWQAGDREATDPSREEFWKYNRCRGQAGF